MTPVAHRPQRRLLRELPPAPSGATTLIGRAESVSSIERLLCGPARLVTITGPGGVGKTRLAQRVARTRGDAVAFCDLSETSDASELYTAVARALHVDLTSEPCSARAGEDRLGRALRARGPLLVVLDNFEQLGRDAEHMLARWLVHAPDARFLVTSRRRLHVTGEHSYELPPLALPASDQTDAAHLADNPAVQLFVQRAQTGGADIATADLPLIADIVRELDGLPLAIELAAARCRLLSPRGIHRRIADRFELLRRRGVGVDRQSTLRATLDWSWSLLTDAARRALASCSVFRGGWDLAAAHAVLCAPGEPQVLDVLEELVDQSLVVVERCGEERRFRLYVSVRAYAAERLDDDVSADRHADHYAAEARRLSEAMRGIRGEEAYATLTREADNIIAAAQHQLRSDVPSALETLVALFAVYERHGPLDAYLHRLDQALAERDGVRTDVLARALVTMGKALEATGHTAAALDGLREALAHALDNGATRTIVEAATALGWVSGVRGDYDEADVAFAHAEETCRDGHDPWLEADLLQKRGYLAYRRGRRSSAEQDMHRAMTLFRALGARRDEAVTLGWLGFVADGRPEHAVPYFERSVAMLEELGGGRHLARHLQYLAVHELDADLDSAERHFDRALALQLRAGDEQQAAVTRSRRTMVLLERGRAREALDDITTALRSLDAESDMLYRGEALALAAAAEAELGLVAEARRRLDQAKALLEPLRYPCLDALTALHARCDLADPFRDDGDLDEIRGLVSGNRLDLSYGLTRFTHRLLARALGSETSNDTLRVADDFAWFEADGQRVSLARRAPMRRLLQALVATASNGETLTAVELIEAGWPGEELLGTSGESRVYTTILRMRRMGFERRLHHDGAGYRLACRVERVPSA